MTGASRGPWKFAYLNYLSGGVFDDVEVSAGDRGKDPTPNETPGRGTGRAFVWRSRRPVVLGRVFPCSG